MTAVTILTPGRAVTVTHSPVALPGFAVVGADSRRDRELRDRVRAAILNAGHDWPGGRITVEGPTRDYDLAVYVGILAASGQWETVPGRVPLGTVRLDGRGWS